jgi:hypothetical protein
VSDETGFRLEQYVGMIMQAAILGLLAWSLNTTVTLRTEVAVLQATVVAVHRDIQRLDERVVKLESRK